MPDSLFLWPDWRTEPDEPDMPPGKRGSETDGLTTEAIAQELGLSRQGVGHIIRRALRKLIARLAYV